MNLFELAAVIKLDDSKFKQGVKDATKSGEGLASTIGSKLAIAAKVGAAAVGAAATAIGTLTKEAISSYADYEQLVGGVETLFGARGAKSVEEYAKLVGKSVDEVKDQYDTLKLAEETMMAQAEQAWKYQGMSVNEYMETATSFAAALTSSCEDSVTAAELADVAIGDMSDNANKMGTDIQSIQNAYQGFAKQNYTIEFIYSPAA